MRWVILTSACACAFTGNKSSPDAAPGSDAVAPDAVVVVQDAPVDASPDAKGPCKVDVTDIAGTNRGRAGDDDGGSDRTPLVCAKPKDRIIGFQMQLSNGNTAFGGPSAYAVSIACANVSIDSAGAATVGQVTTYETTGGGNMGWTPATNSTLTMCQPGWLMSGINVHKDNGAQGRFLDVTIHCARLGLDGKRDGMTEDVVVTGSGNENNGSDTVDCNADEVLVSMPLRAGQGIDSVDMSCTAPRCE